MSKAKPKKQRTTEEELVLLMDRAEKFKKTQNDVFYRKFEVKIERLKKKLEEGNSCTHSKTLRYNWEHDNGYGKQQMLTGLKCLLCNRENSFPETSNHWA